LVFIILNDGILLVPNIPTTTVGLPWSQWTKQ
jgi:hypothetical protein